MPNVDESRARLLEAIGPAPDLTFIRGLGNIGDEFIWAGTRELLSGHVYREIGLDELPLASGELALLTGGGAWSRAYNEYMPEALAIAEQRFERVIILPSSFEIVEDRVREALERSNALVFARELESLHQIDGLCRSALAHDCAFYFDLSAFESAGTGQLNVFREDHESAGPIEESVESEDISATADSLESWLHTIQRYASVHTDRAHVMIAAARLGKQVRYREGNYFKLRAIAESSLSGYDVAPLEESVEVLSAPAPAAKLESRVTIALTGRDDADGARESIESASDSPADVLVLDRNSDARTRAELHELGGGDSSVSLRLADRDLGAHGSAVQATELSGGDYLLLLEYGMTVAPGAVETLVRALDDHPEAIAATTSGGWIGDSGSTIELARQSVEASGPTGWVPIFGTLFRASAFDAVPLTAAVPEPLQSIEFALLAERTGRTLLACPEAKIEGSAKPSPAAGTRFVFNVQAAHAIAAHAEFYARNERLLPAELATLVPQLSGVNGQFNESAARLLLTLVHVNGPEWLIAERMNGGLEPLLGSTREDGPELTEVPVERLVWLEQRNENLAGIESGGWWQLRRRVEPLIGAVGTARTAVQKRRGSNR